MQPTRSPSFTQGELVEAKRRSLTRTVDWVERLAVATVFALLVYLRHDALFDPDTRVWFVLYMLSEGLVVVFILIRRTTDDVTLRPRDWLLTITATFFPMLAVAGGDPLVPVTVSAILVLLGIFLQLSAKIVLARSFGLVAANRGVKVTGPYRLVRHPMYAGYLLAQIGLLLASPLAINFVVYGAGLTLQILRMRVEERLLRADAAYRTYSQRVRYRLLPGVF